MIFLLFDIIPVRFILNFLNIFLHVIQLHSYSYPNSILHIEFCQNVQKNSKNACGQETSLVLLILMVDNHLKRNYSNVNIDPIYLH